MMVTARSCLTVGLAAALVVGGAEATVVAPQTRLALASPTLTTLDSPAVQLAAALQPLLQSGDTAVPAATDPVPGANVAGITQSAGDWIINAYWTIQPWVEYGVELFAWATEWLPWPIGLLAPQSDIIYNAWQPFAESVVYSFAFLVDGQFELILPTLSAGIQTGITNLVQGEIAWILSFFPPLPPIGGAATTESLGRTAPQAPAAESTPTSTAEPAATGATVNTTDTTTDSDPAGTAAESPQPEPAAAEPDIAASPKRQALSAALRAQRPQPAAAAAASADGVQASPAEGRAHPAPLAQSRKATARSASSPAASERTAREGR